MPQIDQEIQTTCWKLADALAKSLRVPVAGGAGDPRWTVSGMANRAWKISHPDLPLVKDEEGVAKDILLQLYIEPKDNLWFVVAENMVVGPTTHSSPKALIVAKEETPPGKDWDIEAIAQAAANFFRKQKDTLVGQAGAAMPQIPPGSGTPPAAPPGGDPSMGGGMDMGMPPMGPTSSRRDHSRRLHRIAALLR